MLEKKFVVEEATDLRTNERETPLSCEIRDIWTRHSGRNIVLENGQMLCLKYEQETEIRISEFMHKILFEYIQSEKNLNRCIEIRNKYIENSANTNNSSEYNKLIMDIIINMDRVYKYVWCIAKILNDNLEKHTDFIEWQKNKTPIEDNIYECWDLLYSIRSNIEHPKDLKTTFFRRKGNDIESPQLEFKGKNYDMKELGEVALKTVFAISRAVIHSSFLYSKYVVCFTDETRTKLYTGQE